MVSRTSNRKIPTSGIDGPNGFVVPIWHVDSWDGIDQVYLTVVNPGCVKGPHLHKVRSGRFTCVKGNALIVTRDEQGEYAKAYTGEDHEFATVRVPAGVAAGIYCIGDEPAYLLNMPSPPWRKNELDEWPVENWIHPEEYQPCVA